MKATTNTPKQALNKAFRKAMSNFSKSARECRSMNDTRIILIDGEELTSLMIDHDLGVSVKEAFPLKRVDTDYFEGEVI